MRRSVRRPHDEAAVILRPGRRIAMGAVTAVLTAGLVALGTAPALAEPPTGGSVIVDETFTGATVDDPTWSVQGDTCLTGAPSGQAPLPDDADIPACDAHRTGPVPEMGDTPGYLQLTDAAGNRAGSILYNQPIPASAGVSVTFDQFQYGGNGADGIGFFLVDGSTALTQTGGVGGSLGYAQRGVEPGVNGGYLGVGLDAYGNFYGDGEGRGSGCPADQRSPTTAEGPLAPNVITLRGPGQGLIGYCWLDSTVPRPITNPNNPGTTLDNGAGTLRANTLEGSHRTVNVQVTPVTDADPDPHVIVQIRYTDDGPWITELDIPAPENTPNTYRFGFSASTGGSNDIHLLRAARIETILPLPNLQLEKQVDRTAGALPAVITAGTVIPYQFTVTNTGAPVDDLTIDDDRITGPITCDRTSLTTAPELGSSAVCTGSYTVTPDDVAAGSVTNVARAEATADGGTVVSPDAEVTVPLVSSITIAKAVDTAPPYFVGQQVTYRYTLQNTGGSNLINPTVGDDRISTAIVCADGTLAPGQSTTCTGSHPIMAGQIGADGYLVNTAHAQAQTPIGQTVTAGPVTARIPVATDVAVTKTVDDGTPVVGSNVTFTITATNNGPSLATGVVLTDVVPDGDPVDSVVYQSSTTTAGTYDAATGAWSIPSLAVDATATLTITVLVNTGTPYTNAVERTATDQPDLDPANDAASATINPVTPTMDVSVEKSVDTDTIPLGGTAVFTVTATNHGPFAASGVQFLDALPSGLAYDAAGSSGDGAYDPVSGVWNIGALAVDATATRTIAVTGTALGTFTNLIALTGDPTPPDINPSNNSASASVTVVRPVSDLAIVKAVFPQTALVGDTVTYQLTANNLGPEAAPNVVVTDALPAGITVVSATTTTGTITPDGSVWTIGTLAPHQSGVTATVTATIDAEGTLVNGATISSPDVDDPDTSNNSDSATLISDEPDVDIAVGKSVAVPSGADPGAVPLGEEVVFTLTAQNIPGPTNAAATEVVLTDQLPDGLTYVSSSGDGAYDPATGLWTVASIASGATATLTIRARVDEPISFINSVSLTSMTQHDTDPTNNDASVGVTGIVLTDLAIEKTVAPDVSRPGDDVTYTVVVTNNGPNDATGVVAFDPFMPAATIVSASVDAGAFDPDTRVWRIGDLANGASATLTVVIQVQNPGWHRNVAGVLGSDGTDPDLSDNVDAADLFVPAADIVVTKTVDAPAVHVGDTVTFTVGVANNGPDRSGTVVVADLLPAGLTYVSHTATAGVYDPTTGAWTLTDIVPANLPRLLPQATLTITATVDEAGTFTNTAFSDREDAPVFDPDLTNNTAEAIVTATPRPAELHVTKTVEPPSVTAGDAVTFTITVTNLGPADAEDVVLDDPFPDGVTPTSTDTPGCTITPSAVTCDLGTIVVGATATITALATVDRAGSFENTATVSSGTPLLASSTLSASADVSAVEPPAPPLPPTGGTGAGALPFVGGLLTLAGLAVVLLSRRRRIPVVVRH